MVSEHFAVSFCSGASKTWILRRGMQWCTPGALVLHGISVCDLSLDCGNLSSCSEHPQPGPEHLISVPWMSFLLCCQGLGMERCPSPYLFFIHCGSPLCRRSVTISLTVSRHSLRITTKWYPLNFGPGRAELTPSPWANSVGSPTLGLTAFLMW